MQNQSASAIFDTRQEAERAVADLRSAGVSDGAFSLVAQGNTAGDGAEATDDDGGNVLRGIIGGGALGAGLGIAALAIPGVGPLVAAGAIAAAAIPGAAAIGAAAGAAAGTLNETLTRHGISEEDAGYYGERLNHGGVLVSVDTRSGTVTPETAIDILHRNGGHNAAQARVASY